MSDDNDERLHLSDTGLVDGSTSNFFDSNDEVASWNARQVMVGQHEGGHRRHEQNQPQTTFKWRITDDDVSDVPEIYPSLCCALVIRDLPVRVIAERVSDFMRLNSIRCEYDNEKARALCTASFVSFVVQLWKSKPCHQSGGSNIVDKNTNNGIVIEVRRRQGCSIGMHRIRHALVRSIKSDNGHPVLLDVTSFLRRRFRPSVHIKELFKSDSFKSLKSDSFKSHNAATPLSLYSKGGLRSTIDLLESDSFHEQDVGIENLCFLSDPTKVRKEEAIEVACALIFRRGEHGGDVQNAMEDYLYDLQHRRRATTNNSVNHKQYFNALTAMANCMALILNEIDEPTLIRWRQDDDSSNSMLKVFWRNVMEVVIQQLGSFRESPSCAAVAARCMRLDCSLAPVQSEDLYVDNFRQLPYLLQSAHEYGKAYNAMLEEESFNLSSAVANRHQ